MKIITILLLATVGASAQVTANYFGIAVSNNSGVIFPSAANPPLQAGTIRLHDSRCDWSDIETSNGVYSFTCIDNWLSQVHGQNVIWTFAKVPSFHSSNATLPCAELTGSCAPPSDVATDGSGTDAAWKAFINAAVTHLTSAGTLTKVTHVEVWNEMNNAASGSAWWVGTASQMVRMAYDLRTIWKAANSAVTIMTPSSCACTNSNFTAGAFVVSTTGNTTSGSANVTLTSGTSTANGQLVLGTGIPYNTTISSGGGTTSIVLSQNATANGTGVTLSFYAAPTYTTTNPQDGMHFYLTATANTTGTPAGGAQADMVDVHTYVGGSAPETVGSGYIAGTFSAMTATGYGSLPLAITEMSWALNTSNSLDGGACAASPPFTQSCLDNMAAWVARAMTVAASRSISIFEWYAWGNNTHGTLYDKGNPPFLLEGAQAFNSLSRWLTGATMTSACTNSSTVWTCALTRSGGYQAELVWDTSQTCSPCTYSTYTVPSAYQNGAQYDLTGDPATITGTTTSIGLKPILLTNSSCAISSPTSGQLFQMPMPTISPTFPPVTSLSVSCSEAFSGTNPAETTYYIDYQRYPWEGFARPDPTIMGDGNYAPASPSMPVTFPTGTFGDGSHTVYGVVQDTFHNVLFTTPSVSFTVNLQGIGASQSFAVLPTTGTGATLTVTSPWANNTTSAYGLLLDGYDGSQFSTGYYFGPVGMYNCAWSNLGGTPTGFRNNGGVNTTCWLNGTHLIVGGYATSNALGSSVADPYQVSSTITAGSGTVNTSNGQFTVTAHQFANGRPICISGSSPPTGFSSCTPWYWGTSAFSTAGTITLAYNAATGVGTATCSSPCGATTSTPVHMENIPYTSGTTGLNSCDGNFLPLTGSGTTFTWQLPAACPWGTITNASADGSYFHVTLSAGSSSSLPGNGDAMTLAGMTGSAASGNGNRILYQTGANTYEFYCACGFSSASQSGTYIFSGVIGQGNLEPEVDVNAYFTQVVDANTITLASPSTSGPPYTFTTVIPSTTGSGSVTLTSRTNSPYYVSSGAGNDLFSQGAKSMVPAVVTISNTTGTHSMMQFMASEFHGWFGKTGDTACPTAYLNVDGGTTTGLTCSNFTYTFTNQGPVTGAISVNSTGAITYANPSSWSVNQTEPPPQGYVTIVDTVNGTPKVSFPIINYGASQPTGIPHFTKGSSIATSYTPGASVIPNGMWFLGQGGTQPWQQDMFAQGNINTGGGINYIGFTSKNALIDPASTGPCPTWPTADISGPIAAAQANGTVLKFDLGTLWYATQGNQSNAIPPLGLSAILNNTGFNRHSCLTDPTIGLIPYLISTGVISSFTNNDELPSDTVSHPFFAPSASLNASPPNTLVPAISSASVTSGVLTITGQNIVYGTTNPVPWVQSTGAGNAIQITNATPSACNGWVLLSTTNSTTQTMTGPAPSGCTGTMSAITISYPFFFYAPFQNISPITGHLTTGQLPLDSTHYITVTSGTATLKWPSHGYTSGTAPVIRIWNGTTANLMTIAPTTYVDANTLSFPYLGTTGSAAPTCTGTGGQCNGTTDPGAYITADPQWGLSPLGTFFGLISSVSGAPPICVSLLGSFEFPSNSPVVYSWNGNAANNIQCSFLYFPNSVGNLTNPDSSMHQQAAYSPNTAGVLMRPFQQRPRYFEWGIPGGNSADYCRTAYYQNQACMKPQPNGYGRPEGIVAQRAQEYISGAIGDTGYVGDVSQQNDYLLRCCGWSSNGTGQNHGMAPYTAPLLWGASTHFNNLIQMNAARILQPNVNSSWMGQGMLPAAAKVSATYGNLTMLECAADWIQGTNFSLPLNQIASGSTILEWTDGYTTQVQQISGNPSSITGQEWCNSPGKFWLYTSLPSGYTPLLTQTFTPPATLPYGAVHYAIRSGTYPGFMADDATTPCDSGCGAVVDNRLVPWYYEELYLDSSFLPVQISTPKKIPAIGMP